MPDTDLEKLIDEVELRKLIDGASAAPYRIGHFDPQDDPVARFAENLSHGSGRCWIVFLPEHPRTVGGWDERPAHAVTVCITGNGPTSEANARYIAATPPSVVRGLLDRIRELQALVERLEADFKAVNDQRLEMVERELLREFVTVQSFDDYCQANPDYVPTYGDLVRNYRKKAGKTLQQTAFFMRVDIVALSEVERNKRAPWSVESTVAFADFVGADPDELLKARETAYRKEHP